MHVEVSWPLIVPDDVAPMYSSEPPSKKTNSRRTTLVMFSFLIRLPGIINTLIPYSLVTPMVSVEVIASVYPEVRESLPLIFAVRLLLWHPQYVIHPGLRTSHRELVGLAPTTCGAEAFGILSGFIAFAIDPVKIRARVHPPMVTCFLMFRFTFDVLTTCSMRGSTSF